MPCVLELRVLTRSNATRAGDVTERWRERGLPDHSLQIQARNRRPTDLQISFTVLLILSPAKAIVIARIDRASQLALSPSFPLHQHLAGITFQSQTSLLCHNFPRCCKNFSANSLFTKYQEASA